MKFERFSYPISSKISEGLLDSFFNKKADYTGVTSHKSSIIEIAVVVIEGVLLVGFSITR